MENIDNNRDKLIEEYNEIRDTFFRNDAELCELKKNDVVKRYLELKAENYELIERKQGLLDRIKWYEYSSCEHILVKLKNKKNHKFCIKCGLNTSKKNIDSSSLLPNERAMKKYLMYNEIEGLNSDYDCEANIGVAIYSRIRKAHPGIDDETAIKYFEIALDKMRNIPVSKERKENRRRRLLLK